MADQMAGWTEDEALLLSPRCADLREMLGLAPAYTVNSFR